MEIIRGGFEFNVLLVLTCVVVVVKFSILVFFLTRLVDQSRKLNLQRKSANNPIKIPLEMRLNVVLLITFFSMIISRIFFMFFDYYYTAFDFDLYVLRPAIYFWIIGIITSYIGQFYYCLTIDKYFLRWKYKWIEFLIVIACFIIILHPYETIADFEQVSVITMFMVLPVFFFTFEFLRFGMRYQNEIKRSAIYLVLGQILLAFAGIVVNAGLVAYLETIAGHSINIEIYFTQSFLKLLSLYFYYKAFRMTINPDKWIRNVWIIDGNSGICIFEANFQQITIDSTLLSGFLVALQNFGQEITQKDIESINFHGMRIFFKRSNGLLLATAVTDLAKPSEINQFMDTLTNKFELKYEKYLPFEGGDIEPFNSFKSEVEEDLQQKVISFEFLRAINVSQLKPEVKSVKSGSD